MGMSYGYKIFLKLNNDGNIYFINCINANGEYVLIYGHSISRKYSDVFIIESKRP